MRNKILLYAAIGLGLIILISGSFYTIREDEQAIVLQFGKPVGQPITNAGLHIKIPFIQDVTRFDKKVLEWDGEANEIPTRDNKYIFIDAFARWHIVDAQKFYNAAKNERIAQSQLDDIIDGSVRDEVSNRVMEEIVRYSERKMSLHDESTRDETMESDSMQRIGLMAGARLDIIDAILAKVADKLMSLDNGVEVIDIQIKRVNYNQQVQEKLFNRMISDQYRIAEKYRAQGQGEKQKIMGITSQRKKEIISEAYLESQKVRGDADGEAVKIYAESYGSSPELYNLLKSLKTYENTIDSTTKLILSTDNQYLKYLEKSR
jgi:membrane protease subunit HflC